MNIKKISAAEFNHGATKIKRPVVKVLNGNAKIDDPFLKIERGSYKWYVLVPVELLSVLNWIQIFRESHKRRAMRGDAQNLEYTSFDLNNGSVLFAFK